MITASFTVAQSTITPQSVTITDTSTGDYDTITKRRVFISNANGDYLTGDGTVNYTDWPLADLSITLSILTEDIGANILVQWLNVDDGIVGTLNNNYPLSQFGKQFFVFLVQLQGLDPKTPSDTNYSSNMALFWTSIIAGDNAVTFGNNIAAAQNCYDRETYMRLHQSLYF